MSSLINVLKNGKFSNYVQIKSNQELIEEFLKKSTKEDKKTLEEVSYITSDLFSSLTKEGKSVYEILKYLSSNYKEEKFFNNIKDKNDIVIFYNADIKKDTKTSPANILVSKSDIKETIPSVENDVTNSKIDNPDRVSSPGFAVILHNKREYRAGSKNSLELQVFSNLLSNVEMSKCYPYFDAKFFLPSVINDKNTEFKEFDTGSITNYLYGTLNNAQKTLLFENFKINHKKSEKIKGQVGNMSLFTAPQTMNNFEEPYGLSKNILKIDPSIKDKRLTTVHDIARPFMTFKNFSIDVAPTKGLMSFKTGRMSLVLHDRTRLNEVSPFIKPELFGPFGAEIDVEYGWTHIQGSNFGKDYSIESSENLIADYIHNSRIKEKYIITNSSFNIDQSGQVNIDLNLSMKGPIIFKHVKITTVPGIELELKELIAGHSFLLSVIKQSNESRDKKNKIKYKRNDEISLLFGNSSIATFTDKQRKSIKSLKLLYKDPTRNRGKIENFFGLENVNNDNKVKSAVDNIYNHIVKLDKAVTNREDKIEGEIEKFRFKSLKEDRAFYENGKWKENVDTLITFYNSNTDKKNLYEKFKIDNDDEKSKYYTLGNIISTLIYQNFITQSASQFDEIQMVFYNLNDSCGLGSGINISNILINKEDLSSFLKDIFKNRITLTLEGFLTNIIKELVQTERNITYGINGAVTTRKEDENQTDYAKRIASINDVLNDIYQAIKVQNKTNPEINNDINIVLPSIHISFDTFPMEDERKTICRISVYDRNDNPFGTLHKIYENSLKQKGSENLFAISREIQFLLNQIKNKAENDTFKKRLKEKILLLINNKYITKDGSSILVNANLGFSQEIKESLKELMPTLVFGQENSPMIEASVSSINDAKLDTVIMTRNGKHTAIQAKFNEKLPLNVKPTQAQVTMIGCPFVNFAQNIFLDFNTGTTIDNKYNVTGLKHDIIPGKFTTSLTLSYGEAFGKYETSVNNIVEGFNRVKDDKNNDDEIEAALQKQSKRKENTDSEVPDVAVDNIIDFSKEKSIEFEISKEVFDLNIDGKYKLEAKVDFYSYVNTNHKIKFKKQKENNLKTHISFYTDVKQKNKIAYFINNILNSKKVSKDFTKIFKQGNKINLKISNILLIKEIKESNKVFDLILEIQIPEDFVLSPSLKIIKEKKEKNCYVSLVNKVDVIEKDSLHQQIQGFFDKDKSIKLNKEIDEKNIVSISVVEDNKFEFLGIDSINEVLFENKEIVVDGRIHANIIDKKTLTFNIKEVYEIILENIFNIKKIKV